MLYIVLYRKILRHFLGKFISKYYFLIIAVVDVKRRDNIIQSLNDTFSSLIEKFSISEAYDKIVESKPYKVLSCFVYDSSYAPLKRRL